MGLDYETIEVARCHAVPATEIVVRLRLQIMQLGTGEKRAI